MNYRCVSRSQKSTFMSLVLNSWGSGWPRTFSNIKINFKRQSLPGKILPDFRDKVLMKSIQKKKVLIVQAFLLCNQKTSSWCLSQRGWRGGGTVAALWIRAALIINLTAFAQNSKVSQSLPVTLVFLCLAYFAKILVLFSLMINVFHSF